MTDKSLAERLRASPTSEIMLEAADYIDGLIAQHHRDSKELRNLCAARDESRKDRVRLRAALADMLDMYGSTRDCEGRRKDDYEMERIETARAALTKQEQGK